MNFKELYDVSLPISTLLAVWPGDPPIEIEEASQISKGDVANVTRLNMGVHSGTHMDAPKHFLEGTTGIDEVPLDALVGTAYVVEIEGSPHIGAAELEAAQLPAKIERILFKTRNSKFWETDPNTFHKDFTALAPDGAAWLLERNIKLVGIDYLSIEQFNPPRHDTHYTLLGERVVIVEGLNLSQVAPGEYTLMALPLKIKNGDGAPARVVLAK